MATFQLTLNEQTYDVEVEEHEGELRVRIGGKWRSVDLERISEGARYSLLLDGRPSNIFAEESPHGYHIVIGSRLFAITTPGPVRGRRAGGPEDMDATTNTGEWVLTSPMAGVVQEVLVEPGDEVEAGQVVIVIEAMKMQNDLRARRAGTVKAVYVSVGQRVDQAAPLLVLL